MRRIGSAAGRGFASVLWILGLLSLAGTAAANDLRIESELDRSAIALGGSATLRVTVTAEGVAIPEIPTPKPAGASVNRLGESQGFSWINGRVTRTLTVAFAVQPFDVGEMTIPTIQITSGGLTARSRPLILKTTREAPKVDRSAGLFARLTVDRTTVYWNQQIVARYTIYVRAALDGAPIWEPPDAAGFWSEPLGPPREGRAEVNGVEYQTSQILVAYFPTRTGKLRLGPGSVHARVVRRVETPDPWSLLGGSERVVEDVRVETEQRVIEVLPLPAGAPEGFRGGVGAFAMDVKIDRKATAAGEPIAVVTLVRGSGNIASAGDPDVTAVEPSRSYATTATTRLERTADHLTGERRREITFVPEAPGRLTIQPVRFSWFDPETGRYRTQVSDSIRIDVKPAGSASADSLRAAFRLGPVAAPRSKPGRSGSLALAPPPAARALALASLLAYAGIGVFATMRRNAARDPKRRARAAWVKLQWEVAALRGQRDSAARLGEVLIRGLALRYGVDLEGLAAPDALARLAHAGAEPDVLTEAERIVEVSNRLAYAPDAEGASDTEIQRAMMLLKRIGPAEGDT